MLFNGGANSTIFDNIELSMKFAGINVRIAELNHWSQIWDAALMCRNLKMINVWFNLIDFMSNQQFFLLSIIWLRRFGAVSYNHALVYIGIIENISVGFGERTKCSRWKWHYCDGQSFTIEIHQHRLIQPF